MSVTRINEFRAKESHGEALFAFLKSIMPMVESSIGCKSCQLLRSTEDPTRFVIIEVWESIESHQASVKNIPPEKFQEAMSHIASPPTGAYYRA